MYKHPKALAILFFTEMWERFSFYGMRALLTLYLTIQLFRDLQEPEKKATAFGIYAAYGALVYATPFIGGLIADKFLGHKKAIIWGAILMAIGHFVMAIETQFWLYIALAFLIIGNGFFKPNISTMVGELYDKNDPRRDGGFTIFYMGVNLGAFLSPLICGTIGELFGWKYGFGIAGIGMILGLIWFLKGQKSLNYKEHIVKNDQGHLLQENRPLGLPPHIAKLKKNLFLGIDSEYLIYILSLFSVGIFAFFVKNFQLMSYVLTPFTIIVIGILFVIALRSQKVEREQLFVVLVLIIFNTLFWSFFEQAGSSLNLFTNENVDRTFFNWQIPASIFQSVNPLFILAFGTLFSMFWLKLAVRKKDPSTPVKFAYGIFLLSLGFMLLGLAPKFISQTTLEVVKDSGTWQFNVASVPMIIVVASYLFQTLGELCLSPVGLSMVTKLVSPKIVGMAMGAWMLSWSLSHHFAGIISSLTTEEESSVEVMWKKFEPTIQDSQVTIPAKEFIKKYKGGISSALNNGFDVILDEGKSIYSNKNDLADFNKQRIFDSTMVVLQKEGVMNQVKNKEVFTQNLLKCFDAGIIFMIDAGDKATAKALSQEYVDKEIAQSYSLTTRHSLSNLLQYTKVFWAVGLIALAASILLFALSPILKKMMHGV